MTSREVVHNRALSGLELKSIMRADFERLLTNEGMLSDYLAFGRAAYEIILRVHQDNPYVPVTESRIASKAVGRNVIAGTFKDPDTGEIGPPRPELAAIEPPPLSNPSPEHVISSLSIHRDIDSPNEERLRNDMPIPVIVQQQDGTKITEMVKYPPQEVGEGNVRIEDRTQEAKTAFGHPDPPQPLPSVIEMREGGDLTNQSMCHCGHSKGSHALSGICTQCRDVPCNGFRDARVALPAPEAWPVVPS